jgi:L-seryl-tRNA(Ser) seleniumtransferase
MAQSSVAELEARAEALGVGNPVPTMSMTGGGSLPGEEFPSAGVEIEGDVSGALRNAEIPVIARVRDQSTVIDLRTVQPIDDALVAKAVASSI